MKEHTQNKDLVDSTATLNDSFDEISGLLEELTDSMEAAADGFASFEDSAADLRKTRQTMANAGTRNTGFAASDD